MLLGLLTTGYSLQRNTISSLVHEKLGLFQTANFLICGVLTIGLAYYLNSQTNSQVHNASMILAGVIVLGLSLVLLGLLPTDRPGQTSLIGQVHGAIFITSVLIQAALQLLVAFGNYPSQIFWYLLISGIITATGLAGMLLIPEMRGIIQRVLVGAIMLWITLASFWLRR